MGTKADRRLEDSHIDLPEPLVYGHGQGPLKVHLEEYPDEAETLKSAGRMGRPFGGWTLGTSLRATAAVILGLLAFPLTLWEMTRAHSREL